MQKKNLFIVLSPLVLIVGILLTFCFIFRDKKTGEELPVVRVGYNTESFNNAPAAIAIEEDFFSQYGIKIELVHFKGGDETALALAAGQIDVGLSSPVSFAIPMAKGGPIKFVGFNAVAPTYLYVRPDEQNKTFEDLLGKKIASVLGSSSDLVLRRALKQEGVDINQIEFLPLRTNERPIALMEKEEVAASIVSGNERELFEKAGAVPMEEWVVLGYGKSGDPRVVGMNTDFLSASGNLAEAFMKGYIEGFRFIVDDPNQAAKILSAAIEKNSGGTVVYTPEDILNTWTTRATSYVIWTDPEEITQTLALSFEVGVIDKALTTEEIFDFRFQEILEKAQEEIYETEN